ncbi:MAG: hypothetical protein AAF441_25955 [Pseudomonadota bacterium]
MVSKERLIWLLGEDIPARVIPAGLIQDPDAEMADEDHVPLHSLRRVPANWHPEAVPGHDNHILRYPHDRHHDHQILISVSDRALLDHHLKTTKVWIQAVPPGEEEFTRSGPEPIYLDDLIERAVKEVTGLSLAELSTAVGDHPPGDLASLLDDVVSEVRNAAMQGLTRGLERFVRAGVIEAEDLDALKPGPLVDALLTEPRVNEADEDAGVITTTLLHAPGVDQMNFSMKIES